MFGKSKNQKMKSAFYEQLEAAGLQQYFPVLKGSKGAVQLQHVLALKQQIGRNPGAIVDILKKAGVADEGDCTRLAALLRERLQAEGGLQLKAPKTSTLQTDAEAWHAGLVNEHGQLPAEFARVQPSDDDIPASHRGEAGEIWPAGMKIVNGHMAHSIRAQGMLKEPNTYGYIHLAAEIEFPGPFRKNSPEKRALLTQLKEAAHALQAQEPEVRRADVFDAFLVHPGAKEGWELLAKGPYDVHPAEFDVVVLVECEDVESAERIRQSKAFLEIKQLLDQSAQFVHCITAKNAKRIDEVDKTRDGIFLFNYFFAADVAAKGTEGLEILLAVWEYTAGWWTAKANLTNSTPLQPLPGEHSSYSLINHCRWNKAIDIVPHLLFRPTLGQFVLGNFTANDIVAMPVLYHLA